MCRPNCANRAQRETRGPLPFGCISCVLTIMPYSQCREISPLKMTVTNKNVLNITTTTTIKICLMCACASSLKPGLKIGGCRDYNTNSPKYCSLPHYRKILDEKLQPTGAHWDQCSLDHSTKQLWVSYWHSQHSSTEKTQTRATRTLGPKDLSVMMSRNNMPAPSRLQI